MIKESIHTSEKVNAMTDFQFRLWVNLIAYVDDYGRGDARAAIIKGSCFPLRERLTNKDIESALAGLAGIGCIGLYNVDGRPYLYFPNWEQHQTIRNKRSKYPAPSEGNLRAIENNCTQLHANVPVIQTNPIQSESETESNARGAFEVFWKAYPKKVNKRDAEKAFKAINTPLDVLLAAIEKQKQSRGWLKDNGDYIPYPATWLRKGGWENDVAVTKEATRSGPTQAETAEVRRLLEEL
jgi:hypothetical protein